MMRVFFMVGSGDFSGQSGQGLENQRHRIFVAISLTKGCPRATHPPVMANVGSRCVPFIGKKAFFSEEKKQKTFLSLSPFSLAACTPGAKVFWFFFSKKNRFPSFEPRQCSAKPVGVKRTISEEYWALPKSEHRDTKS
jgi:hypothetical protein